MLFQRGVGGVPAPQPASSALLLLRALRLPGLLLAFWTTVLTPATALGQPSPTEQQIKRLALEALRESPELVLEIIRDNPEVVTQAVAILQEREQAQQAQAAQAALATHRAALFDPSGGPTLGNPDGDVTLVEFFDYNCGYCRRTSGVLQQLLEADPEVRVLLREWPILGEGSRFAARASLAAQQQGRYQEFHRALLELPGQATEKNVMDTARRLGLDVEQLRRDMAAPEVDAHLARSDQLARALGFRGTPGFVVGNTVAPGFIELERLQELVRQARSEDAR